MATVTLRRFLVLTSFTTLLVLQACGGGGGGESAGGTDGIAGNIQKGPFILGSTITIQELDDNLDPTGIVFNTETTNDLGAFDLASNVSSRFVEIIADGFYFDEIINNLSQARLTLRTISDLEQGSDVKINLLTILAKSRLKVLMSQGLSFADAQAQAQAEVLAMFNIFTTPDANFDRMDISQPGDANAILLATSAVLLQAAHNRNPDAVAAELSWLLSSIYTNLQSDGILNSITLEADLLDAGMTIDLTAVRQNLESRYADLGEGVTAPAFEEFIDVDGDGLVNHDDPDSDGDGFPDVDDEAPFDPNLPSPWVQKASTPTAKMNPGSATLGEKIFVIGGRLDHAGGNYTSTVQIYDPLTDQWSSGPSMSVARDLPATATVGGKIYVIGGSDTFSGTGKINEVFDPIVGAWEVKAPMPTERYGAVAAQVGGKIFVAGGFATISGASAESDVLEEYDPTLDQWATKEPMGVPRMFAAIAESGGIIYVFGGIDGSSFSNVVEAYDPSANSWTTKSPMPTARSYATAAVLGDKIYVFGGLIEGGERLSTVELYDPVNNSWRAKTPMPIARRGHAMGVVGGKAYVISGIGQSTALNAIDKVYEYDPAFDLK